MNSPPFPNEVSPRAVSFFARILPCLLAFIASFCVMVVELVAGRVIAKHVGASLYTWTSVIGVVLGGITIGNLIGGRLADRFNTRKTLACLFLLAALACLAVPLVNYWLGEHELVTKLLKTISEKNETINSWPSRIAVHVILVFLLPSAVLGLIGPVVAKMALDHGRAAGRTVGNVYAWGALGSIVGTFLTGFYLVQAMGTVGIIFSVAGMLAAVGLSLAPAFIWPFFISGCVLFTLEAQHGPWEWRVGGGQLLVRERPASNCLYTTESQYSYIEILDKPAKHRRDLILDNLIHAHYVPTDVTDLQYDYEEIYAAVTQRFGGSRNTLNALFLGGGGYIFPRYIQARWPGSSIQVAEIDPAVTQADMEAFGLAADAVRVAGRGDGDAPDGGGGDGEEEEEAEDEGTGGSAEPSGDADEAETEGDEPDMLADAEDAAPAKPIEVHHLDARNHVEDLVRMKRAGDDFEPFDFVYGDAFNDYAVPFHLITKELNEKVKEILRPETGIYLVNIIDIFDSGRFLGGIYNTMLQVFPHVYVFSNTKGGPNEDKDGRDTFIVIGALRDLDLAELGSRTGEKTFDGSLLEEKHIKVLVERSQGIVLTDDYAPVENLLAVVVKRR